MRLPRLLLLLAAAIGLTTPASAEDGYDLWLRYRPLVPAIQAQDRPHARGVIAEGDDPRVASAAGTRAAYAATRSGIAASAATTSANGGTSRNALNTAP